MAELGYWVEVTEIVRKRTSEYVYSYEAASPEDAIRIVEGKLRLGTLASDMELVSRDVSYSIESAD